MLSFESSDYSLYSCCILVPRALHGSVIAFNKNSRYN